ncbi:MAG: CvpA family protein [Phycisphaerae bacterium]|nr:CvpA family protein [Phycisphaerae bacterium]
MLFVILSLLLFAGIAFFQTLQGTYSALIMVVLTILSAALSANYYGVLSQAFFIEYIPDYADAVSLAAIFFITLMVLRTLSDHFIRSNIVIYPLPDRICAGLLSIPSALLIVGMGSISLELLPYNDQVMLFDRFKTTNGKTVQKGIFPFADEFTGGLLAKLSNGSLRSGDDMDKKFGAVHSDWASETSAGRIAIQKESRHAVVKDAVRVTRVWKLTSPLVVKNFELNRRYHGGAWEKQVTLGEKRYASDNASYLAMTIELDSRAADGDGFHRFGWGQVRLVGFKGNPANERMMNMYAIGFRDPSKSAEFDYMRVNVPIEPPAEDDEAEPGRRNYGPISKNNTFDVVFEVPEDFTPWFLEYKRWARASMPKMQDGKTAEPESVVTVPTDTQSPAGGSVGETERAGWHSELQVDSNRTRFTKELPFTVKLDAVRNAGDAEFDGSEFARGRIAGDLGTGQGSLNIGISATIREFSVPQDKRLLRVECDFSPAQNSLLQKIFGAVQGVSQKKAISKDGTTFLPVGQYVMVNDSNGQQVELIYEPDMEGQAMTFQKVQMSRLRGSGGKIGLLYLVPPGTELSRFEIGGVPIEAQTLQLSAPR